MTQTNQQYVMAVATGKTATIELVDDPKLIDAALKSAFTAEDLGGPLVVCDVPFAPAPKSEDVGIVPPNNQLPPNPTMTALGMAPQKSQILILGNHPLTYQSPTSGPTANVYEEKRNMYFPVFPQPGKVMQYLKPLFPDNSALLYRRYWNLVHGEIVRPGTPSASGSYSITEGMESTTSMTLAAELGLMVMDLGVKLTATFGFQVSISHSTTTTTNINWSNPDTTKNWVVAKYQLVDEIVFAILNSTTNEWDVLSYDGIFKRPGHDTKHPVTLPSPDSIMGGAQFTQIVFGPF